MVYSNKWHITADNDSDKGQTRPLVRQGAPHGQDSNCKTDSNNWLWARSQSQLRLHRDSLWNADSNSESPSSNNVIRRKEDWPVRSNLAADARKNGRLAVVRPSTQRRPVGSQSSGCLNREERPARSHPAAGAIKTDEPARYGRSFAGIHRARPVLEILPFWGPTTLHRLPHTLP
jgi:hypothetical protein